MTKPVYVGKNNRAILDGLEDITSWTEEELIRGQRRSASGRWQGRPPTVVPKVVHDELVKRKMTKAYELLSESIYDAVKVLVDVAKDSEADPNVRIKAATEILNRTVGKPKENVELQFGPRTRFEDFGDAVVVWADEDVIEVLAVEARKG